MNSYADIALLKSKLGVTGTTLDAELLTLAIAASREIDAQAGRVFYVIENEARVFDGSTGGVLLIDDLLSASEVATDVDGDESYGDTWAEGTEYVLEPRTTFPKTALRVHLDEHDMTLGRGRRLYFRITGNWGAGDMKSATPWRDGGFLLTAADDTTTSVTLSSGDYVSPGMTIRCDEEQMFVESVAGTAATVIRGVNNTESDAHTSEAVSFAQYPETVVNATAWLAASFWREFASAGYESERIGDYSYKMAAGNRTATVLSRLVNSVRRRPV